MGSSEYLMGSLKYPGIRILVPCSRISKLPGEPNRNQLCRGAGACLFDTQMKDARVVMCHSRYAIRLSLSILAILKEDSLMLGATG